MNKYERMYYHLAGRMSNAVDMLDTVTEVLDLVAEANCENVDPNAEINRTNAKVLVGVSRSLTELKNKLKAAQLSTEEMLLGFDDPAEGKNENEPLKVVDQAQ